MAQVQVHTCASFLSLSFSVFKKKKCATVLYTKHYESIMLKRKHVLYFTVEKKRES